LGISFGEPSQPSHQSSVTVSNDPTVSGSGERRPTTKESILALYNLPKPVPSTTSAPAVGANSGNLLFSLTMQPNRSLLFDEEYNKEYKPMHFFYSQNGNAVPSFAVAATSGQMPPTCQPSAPQPTTASNFSWTSLKQQQQPQAAPRFHPPSTDPFDSMDVFQSAAPTYAAKFCDVSMLIAYESFKPCSIQRATV
uniref:SPL2 n=1 Tax=Hymenolepis diminuta TaxID=6216 RepID=A0A0R3SMS1_HYMDI